MSRARKQPEARPWDQPGHTFSIGWPPGYEHIRAQELSTEEKQAAAGSRGGKAIAVAQLTAEMRAGGMSRIVAGRGSIPGVSARLAADIDKNERVRRGGL